jgi:hypothetical protein
VTAQYPEERAYLESRLIAETRDEFLSVRDINVADAVPMFAGKDIYAYFIDGLADLKSPLLQRLYAEQVKLSDKGAPSMPLFVYKAIGDEYCPITQTDSTVKAFCGGGADVLYERNKVGTHVSEIENGKPRAMRWLQGVFGESHEGSRPGCIVRDVEVAVN